MPSWTDVANTTRTSGNAAWGSPPPSLPILIGRVINISLALIGFVFLLIALYAGFQWMTAGGETKKVQAAQAQMKNAIIGLVVMFAAYGITSFVMNQVISTGVYGIVDSEAQQ